MSPFLSTYSSLSTLHHRIGPEPTTDSFTAVMYGENEQVRLWEDQEKLVQ